MTEYRNSFSFFSATAIDIQKRTKKKVKNTALRAVAIVIVNAEKYWDHIHGSDS